MKNPLVLGIGTLIVLAGLYMLLRHEFVNAPAAVQKEFRLTIADSKPGQEGTIVQARLGDTIKLVIVSDRPGELEIHGYDQKVGVMSHGEVTLTFDAKHTGRFPIHLHANGEHLPIGVLEVEPR